MIRVVLAGAAGKMGKEVVKAIDRSGDIQLVGAVSPLHAGTDAGELAGIGPCGVLIEADLATLLAESRPDVMIDFTTPEAVKGNARLALEAGVRPVIGATGLSPADLDELRALTESKGLGTLVAPNFAIGALLMMEFAARAAKYFDHAEVIELHHNQKLDAPSGTAFKTVEAMAQAQAQFGVTNVPETEKLAGVRGGEVAGIRVHSVRLPGMLAHQEVLFGGLGQVLTIRHDAMSRECYMPGVLLGVRQVMGLKGLTYGLEHVL
ncbi:MAG: 4-hydroxy-tetrahydrodipicolinate reductase [Candidatus Sericytochromatia bacterium]